ncbi:uncharacterized protein BJX67DRAFT_354413 [Aspergillus lucknowensis]|uniref:Extracellular membrane protein CFEM domain-containing protein n=1 Tax=Aspergillus lucknowensis TaxID=176173 RepID=A0ABR4LR80_9EURO
MSSTTTSASPACTGNILVLPVQDAACGLSNTGNNTDIMTKCCRDADVEKYNDDCGLYCLAQGQNIGDLSSCIQGNGVNPSEIFCRGNMTATATAPAPSQTDDNDGDDDDEDATPTDDDDDGAEPTGAAVRLGQPVSKAGLGLLAMLFSSAFMGIAA